MSARASSRLRAAYAAGWRRLPVPRSAAAMPSLPAEPLSRRFGSDRGRPVDRVYIERFLERHASDIRGRDVVEVYEPTYGERFGAARVDVLDADPRARHATIHGDFAALPDGAFDCFICTQTLQLVGDLEQAAAHALRCLRPGGVLLATAPGISHRSGLGGEDFPDLWRLPAAGMRRIFPAGEVRAHGNVVSSAAFLYGMAEEDLPASAFSRDDPDYELVVTLRAVRA